MTHSAKNCLVTGATGFIGRRLIERLSQENLIVYCVASPERSQAGRLPPSSAIVPVEVDMSDAGQLREVMEDLRPEVVINLAAQGVNPDDRDRQSILTGNVGILAGLLESLREIPPRRVIHIGSWSEYANPSDDTLIAEDHPVLPMSLYGAAKAATTIYGNALAQQLAIPFVVLRLFNVFGVGERRERLIPHLIDRLSQDQPADLTQGDQTRDFLYVDDVVQAIFVAAGSDTLSSVVYNVCSGRAVDVRLVAHSVADILGKPYELLRFGARPYRHDEPLWMVGDNSRFRAATGWRPTIGLEEGIQLMVESLRGVGVGSEDR